MLAAQTWWLHPEVFLEVLGVDMAGVLRLSSAHRTGGSMLSQLKTRTLLPTGDPQIGGARGALCCTPSSARSRLAIPAGPPQPCSVSIFHFMN